ncbi:MAG: MarR family transcriptional regulator [Deltaproteobacteria bacterium]|nr:MarR family transcriptional regulator [Deltaproteobacteria bacterium]
MTPPPKPDPPSQKPWPSEILVSDAIGRLMEFWGFKRNMGRVWAVLHLSDRPLSAAELRSRLGLSSGAVSMTVNELSRWGVIKRVWQAGERRDYFVPEGNIWKMVSRVYAQREKLEVLDAIDAFEQALTMAEEKAASATPEESERAARQVERIRGLLKLARLGRTLIEALIERGRIDATPLLQILLGQSRQ